VVRLPDSWHSHNISYGLSAHTYIKHSLINLERMCDTVLNPSWYLLIPHTMLNLIILRSFLPGI
jgi:hypothetical protein